MRTQSQYSMSLQGHHSHTFIYAQYLLYACTPLKLQPLTDTPATVDFLSSLLVFFAISSAPIGFVHVFQPWTFPGPKTLLILFVNICRSPVCVCIPTHHAHWWITQRHYTHSPFFLHPCGTVDLPIDFVHKIPCGAPRSLEIPYGVL